MAKKRSFTKTLAFIGGIFIIIEGILGILVSFKVISIQNLAFFLVDWYFALIAILIGFLVLISCDAFKRMKGLRYNGWLLLILGILGLVLTYWHVGGALVIIASILWIIGKK
ncbi:MAG: hypothetical protein JW776_13220 [Candidatus Lokiarchaeota archaeon]|nr:hypothetical protein [Candidatus Lokiarchaeota archaeon]